MNGEERWAGVLRGAVAGSCVQKERAQKDWNAVMLPLPHALGALPSSHTAQTPKCLARHMLLHWLVCLGRNPLLLFCWPSPPSKKSKNDTTRSLKLLQLCLHWFIGPAPSTPAAHDWKQKHQKRGKWDETSLPGTRGLVVGGCPRNGITVFEL